jgi:hypothetical protein
VQTHDSPPVVERCRQEGLRGAAGIPNSRATPTAATAIGNPKRSRARWARRGGAAVALPPAAGRV